MKYAEFVREDRLLEILLFLAVTNGYGASNYLLREAIDHKGHSISMELLKADLAWLAEHGLITVMQEEDSQIARLKQRGLDVAEGRSAHPGVKRPKPE